MAGGAKAGRGGGTGLFDRTTEHGLDGIPGLPGCTARHHGIGIDQQFARTGDHRLFMGFAAFGQPAAQRYRSFFWTCDELMGYAALTHATLAGG
jgi:hypothetical protein